MDETRFKGLEPLGSGSDYHENVCTMLAQAEIFRELERPEIEFLAKFVQAWRAPPRAVLFWEGRRNAYLCVLVEGKLEVFKESEGERRRHLATIEAGMTIGEMSLIDDQPHSASVIAATEVKLLTLTKQALLGIGAQHPTLGFWLMWKIATLLSSRLRQTSGRLVERM